jgi:hypothetical protein
MRIRRFAAALVVLGALAAAAPAATQQQERWQGMAAARRTFGITSTYNMPSADAARADLVNSCVNNGWGSDCSVMALTNGCAAIAYNERGHYQYSGVGATEAEAKAKAYANCTNGGHYCDNDMSVCPFG